MNVYMQIATALLSAIFGYILKEYQDRIYPFSKALGILKGINKQTKLVEVDEEIIQRFNKTTLLPNFDIPTSIKSINNVQTSVLRFKNEKNDVMVNIDIVLENISSSKDNYDKQLISILKNDFFYYRLRALVYEKVISFSSIVKDDTKIKIPFVRNKDHKGNIIFEFPSQTIGFGGGFDEYDYLYKLMEPFIIAISQRDTSFISDVFEKFKSLYNSAANNIEFYYDKIQKILDDNNQWGFLFFVANNSSKPFILGNEGKIKVRNLVTKANYEEEVYLVQLTVNSDGEEVNKDYDTDIIIEGCKSLKILAVTKKTEKNMENGLAIRNTYEQNQGKIDIELPIYRLGIKRESIFKIKNIDFNSANEIEEF